MNHTYVLYCNVFIDEQIGVKVIHTDDKFVLVYLLFIFPHIPTGLCVYNKTVQN